MPTEENNLAIFSPETINPNDSIHDEAIGGILGLLQNQLHENTSYLLRQESSESQYLWGWRVFCAPSDFSTERWPFLTWQEALIDLIKYLLQHK
ncbi:MAG: hypothetical protein ACRC80_08595 [Waterburya sp.]